MYQPAGTIPPRPRGRPDAPPEGRPCAVGAPPDRLCPETDSPARPRFRDTAVPPPRRPTPPESRAPRPAGRSRRHACPPTRAAAPRLSSPGGPHARPDSLSIARDRGRRGITWSPRHKRPCGISSRKGPKVRWCSWSIAPPAAVTSTVFIHVHGACTRHGNAWAMVVQRIVSFYHTTNNAQRPRLDGAVRQRSLPRLPPSLPTPQVCVVQWRVQRPWGLAFSCAWPAGHVVTLARDPAQAPRPYADRQAHSHTGDGRLRCARPSQGPHHGLARVAAKGEERRHEAWLPHEG